MTSGHQKRKNQQHSQELMDLEKCVSSCNGVLSNFSDGSCCTRLSRPSEFWERKLQQQVYKNDNASQQSQPQQSRSLSMDEISKIYAPVGLKSQFEELYRILHPSLVERSDKTNASAFLQGARGSGKSLLLNQCIEALQDELKAQQPESKTKQKNKPPFRIVRLNGIMIPGHNVSLIVREILRQLSTTAFQETEETASVGKGGQEPYEKGRKDSIGGKEQTTENKRVKKSTKILSNEAYMEKLLRLRKTSFTNSLQLLNEILQLACVDEIPILFVLDELDAFLGSSSQGTHSAGQEENSSAAILDNVGKERQLLLYHLLDRVATQGSYVCFAAMTSHQGTIGMLEKRIRSRAEGTSRFIHTSPCPSFEALTDILLSKFQIYSINYQQPQAINDSENDSSSSKGFEIKALSCLRQQVADLLKSRLANDDGGGISNKALLHRQVYEVLQREYRLGKDLRWFSRVFSLALSLYRQDCIIQLGRLMAGNIGNYDAQGGVPPFTASYVKEALIDMGGSFVTDIVSAGERDCVTVEGHSGPVDRRLRTLNDLSGPQVALLLASRRILARDSHKEDDSAMPLTLDRIMEEYQSYRGKSNRYSRHAMFNSFKDCVEMGILRSASDHSGTGPLQYNHSGSIDSLLGMDPNTAGRVPLHLPLDIHREIPKVLEKNLLDCSTELRNWGRKLN